MGLNYVNFQGLPGLGSLRLLVATFFVLKLSTKFSPSHFANGGGLLGAVGQVVAVVVGRDDLEQIQLNLNLGDLGSDLPSI